ncbi:hypothetical protein HNR46_003234 [Haloferula luteola]|uniref:Uncharacterized protein n=1 Tax=Haloferula luteola TaxID=595692 RepID=A0A840VBR0_9BACT|nr:hypothetical protein [Haloferula luteola]MBB5352984.1 hypothetical protein [Haloferula luteola]
MRTQLESADIFDLRVTQREGVNRDPGRDGVRYFTFDADAIKSDVSLEEDGIISRTFRVGDLLQTADDRSPGGKTPFAVFSLKIRRSSLVRGSYLSDTEEHSYVDGDRYFDSLFTPVSTFEEVAAIAEKPLPISEAPQVLESAITPDGVFSVAIASAEGLEGWRVVGGTSPESWTDDLTEQTTIVPLPTPAGGAAIHRVSFQSTGRGPNYFIRLEKPEN